ncbi:zinc-dependent alcohol dehydrogenase family protein [Roseicella aerolata]|uniref:Zinc-dependent alcohol dehydrogenase family protein n=1 Tax=Roseicella aerolata TaxID=2883479 RepID=A0A9X1IH09_9PROT|nr:zinc-dependent alcohol dehydrogenase family protein [Roseicella aerolata]MCB4824415.1 zinc-dependent alcohol dehydrogenase family protein [Roseicella aerolata]
MRMQAAIMFEQGKPRPYATSQALVIEEVELEGPGPGEVLIEVAAAGLCHSDLSAIEGIRPRPLPVVIGHEGAGIVREVGQGITDLKPGDHVITVFVASCGICRNCVRGRPNICSAGNAARAAGTLLSGAKRISRLNGEKINHGSGLSLFAQYAVVGRRSAVKIDPSIPLEDAAIFGCAVMTGAGAVLNTARMQAGDTIAVVGLGGVGMNALFAAVAGGAERIIAVDANPEKLGLARQWGATETFLATEPDCAEQVKAATDGGVDTVIETAGNIRAMELAYAITARGGSVVSAGLPAQGANFSYMHAGLVSDEKSILGSYMGSCVAERDIPRFLGLYRRGKLPVGSLKSGFLPLSEINAGFDRLAEGNVLRQVLKPNG